MASLMEREMLSKQVFAPVATRKKFKAWPCALLSAIGLVVLSSHAFAVDWTIGAGVGIAPDYEGSEDYEAVPLWNLTARDLYDPNTYVQVVGPKFNSNFLPHENFRLGLSAQYIFERDDVDNNRVDDMRKTDDGVLLGVLVGYDFKLDGGRVLGFEFDPRWDIEDDIGGLFTGRLKYAAPFGGGAWMFNGGFETTYASGGYMDEYFSVDSRNAGRSGLDRFNADDGFKDLGLNVALTYNFTQNWSATGSAAYKRLLSDAEDSPVTDDEGSANQFIGGLRIDYRF
jgi:outer membrane scaffolding protein for murein synthesis (MipA/OmpV family)